MNKINLYLSLICVFLVIGCSNPGSNIADQNFNKGWRFIKAELDAKETSYDDSQWQPISLPHDWAIFGPFSTEHNARTGGLPVTGMGWYRKHFTVDSDMKGKVVSVEFDGAMNDAYVWVNGELVGNRPFGYMGFEFDISKHVKFGGENVIAVRLNPKDLSSRWYPGAGLYRNVRIKYNEPIHIAQWGTYITTPSISKEEVKVDIQTTINNAGNKQQTITLKTVIIDDSGAEITSSSQDVTSSAGKSIATTILTIANPTNWDIENPYLYKMVSQIIIGQTVIDEYESSFGVRTLEITSNDGLILNGRRVNLNGVCMHHDMGPLGSAVSYRAIERQMQIMQSMGVNALRTSHNPPAPEMLEICDKLGILVIVEAFDEWAMGKVVNGYNNFFAEWHERDLRDMIKRDRNHPSVIMWSIGNEILEQSKEDGWVLTKELTDICHHEDPTRKVTIGFNYYPAPFKNKLAYQVDVVGMNYWPLEYDDIKEANPDMIIYGSETSSQTSSRGIYHLPIEAKEQHETGHASSYDVIVGPPWAYAPDMEFEQQEKNTFSLGEFIWTGFDYLGEPTPYGGRDNSTHGHWNDDWPSHSSYFAPVDLVGFPKDRYYLYQSQWTTEPMVHVLPHWNWEGMEGKRIPVYAYTNAEEVELFVNGKSKGKKVKGKDLTTIPAEYHSYKETTFKTPYRLSWEVPYEAGELKVVAYTNGKAVATKTVNTSGKPAGIRLEADRNSIQADGLDLSYIAATIVDANGIPCPNAANMVNFEIEGNGTIAGVGNGDPRSLTSLKGSHMEAFTGKLMLIIQSSEAAGEIRITASAEGMKDTQIVIQSTN